VFELTRSGVDDEFSIMLMYAPAILQNVSVRPSLARSFTSLFSYVDFCSARRQLHSRNEGSDSPGPSHAAPSLCAGSRGARGGIAALRGRARYVRDFRHHHLAPKLRRVPTGGGVYEVGCVQVATWSKSTKQLQEILETSALVLNHLSLRGSLGEAEISIASKGMRF
jgi:hypothetical protein